MTIILLAACGGGDTGLGADATPKTPRSDDLRVVELAERRARWEVGQPASYQFTVEAQCFCLDTFSRPRNITVENGLVVSEDPAPGDTADPDRILSVDDLFDRAGRAIDEADAVEIEYDNDFDFPSIIAVDELVDAIDDEVTYVVTSFEVVSI